MRIVGLLVVVLSLAACSAVDTAVSTTESPATTSTTMTTIAPATTRPPTTTTIPATTTTTMATTTTTLLEGNWADEPLVVTRSASLGWWGGDSWVASADESLPVVGGEDYQVVTLGTWGVTTGGPPLPVCDPLDNEGVELDDPDLLGDYPGPIGVAISAPWPIVPRPTSSTDDDGTYSAFASELLEARGLAVAQPKIKQLLSVDLEGDGVNEVVVVAEDATLGFSPVPGDYSIAFIRKVVQGAVETYVLGESVADGAGEDQLQLSFTIGAVADLNGDGQMEIVLDWAYYEGTGVQVWEYLDDDIGMVKAMEGGCGV